MDRQNTGESDGAPQRVAMPDAAPVLDQRANGSVDTLRTAFDDHTRRTTELAASVNRIERDALQSDDRVAAVETALLRAREENNELISYLEAIFARLDGLEQHADDLASEMIDLSRGADRLTGEHELTRDLAINANSLGVALTERLGSLPTADDVIALSAEIDTRLAELMTRAEIAELLARLDEHRRRAESELSTRLEALGVELRSELRAMDERHTAEIRKLEIRLSTMPRTEDVVALATRMDEQEMISTVRVAKQLANACEALEASIEAAQIEHANKDAVLRAHIESLPSIDEVTAVKELVEMKLAAVPKADDLRALASRVDQRIDDARDQAAEAKEAADKARDRAEFAGDGVADVHDALERELDELRLRLAEVAKNVESVSGRPDSTPDGSHESSFADSLRIPDPPVAALGSGADDDNT